MYRAGVRTHSKSYVKLGLGIVVVLIASGIYVGINATRHTPAPLVQTGDYKPSTAATPAKSYRGLPTRLKIPSIGVDTTVESLGNTLAGAMAAPAGSVSAGWYKYGAIPGETGSAVIAGHVVGSRGEPGVFTRLGELAEGNTIEVVDSKGQTASFTVRLVRTYEESDQHAEVFSSNGGIHLNLITCAGDWDSGRREYMKRLVVFADKIP